MSTVIETNAAVDYTGEIITPVKQALLWFDLGDTLARSLQNLAQPDIAASVLVIAPDISASYVSFHDRTTQAKKINTSLADDTGKITAFVVARKTETTGFFRPISNFIATGGFSIRLADGAVAANCFNTTLRTVSLSGANTAEWGLYAARWDSETGEVLIRDYTNGTETVTILDAPLALSASAFAMGGNPGHLASTPGDAAIAAVYQGILTDAEMAEVVAFIRSEMAIKLPDVTI